MGCISSKIITRSRSYQEELNQSFQRRDNGLPVLEELFISKNGGGDRQFLALVCCTTTSTKDTVDKKLQTGCYPNSESRSDGVVKPSVLPAKPAETINSWELMEGLDEELDQQQQQQGHVQLLSSPSGDHIHEPSCRLTKRRSKSFHWFVEHDLSSSMEGSFAKQKDHGSNKNNNNKMGILRSRSFHFHTLQEYEEMVERKRWLQAREADINPEDSVTYMMKVQLSYLNCETNSSNVTFDSVHKADNVEIIEGKDEKCRLPGEDAIEKDKRLTEEDSISTLEPANKSRNAEIETIEDEFRSHSSSSIAAAEDVTDVVEEDGLPRNIEIMSEKGLRRKALAKELASLSIPSSSSSTIEFPAIGSLRQWMDDKVGEQQVHNCYYSSEAYVTPKFGSFSLPVVPVPRKRCSSSDDHSIFESEIVAAFEEAMQLLQVEEDSVLRQIGEHLLEEDGTTGAPSG